MKRIIPNPAYDSAPFEWVYLDKDGNLVSNPCGKRYATQEDCAAHRNPVPEFILVDDEEQQNAPSLDRV